MRKHGSHWCRTVVGMAGGAAAFWAVLWAGTATAFERYNDGCQTCHGAFTDDTSPKGTVFDAGDKHDMHRNASFMDTECDLCHTQGDGRDPFIGSSDGTVSNPGVGCTGCHGRDYGGGVGNSGAGLRAHHFINGVTTCLVCHPSDPPPLPERFKPTYYGTPDTNADDPCNSGPLHLENWSSTTDTLGLDNDGDNAYDEDDGDCSCLGDLNGDGRRNFTDFTIFSNAWQTSVGDPNYNPVADLNGDARVNFTDFTIFNNVWQVDCP